jgi:hypothetical protein
MTLSERSAMFYYIITKKGIKRASADVGFMFIACNLRRLMKIIDEDMLTKFLKEFVFLFSEISSSLEANIFKISHRFFKQLLPQTFLQALNHF